MRHVFFAGLTSLVLFACGAEPIERDVTLRITRNDEVVHAAGLITDDVDAVLVARFSLDEGKTATLVIQGRPSRVVSYEEWRGEHRLFAGVIVEEAVVGRLDDVEVGGRIAFHCVADDGGQRIVLNGAATVTAIRGAPVEPGPIVEYEDHRDDDVAVGCDSTTEPYPYPEPEPEPEPDPEYDDEEWESSGGCGGIEGDTVEDDVGEEDDVEWDDGADEEWDDSSASGCEGDTYEAHAARSKRRTRRAVRGAWVMLWPIGVVAFGNRRLRRRVSSASSRVR